MIFMLRIATDRCGSGWGGTIEHEQDDGDRQEGEREGVFGGWEPAAFYWALFPGRTKPEQGGTMLNHWLFIV